MKHHVSLMLGLALGASLLAFPLAWADGGAQCARQGGERHFISHSGGHTEGGVSAHMLRHLFKNKQALGLTEDQITKIRTVALDADRAHIRAEADVMVSKRELRTLLWDEKAELGAIEAKVKEQEAFEATVRIIGIRAKRELMGVLTPEQRNKQKALWEQGRHHDRGHMMKAEVAETTNKGRREVSTGAFEIELSELEGESSAG